MKFRSRGGFSLVELLTVVAIIAILSVLVAPSVSGHLGAQRLSTTAAELTAEFGEARQLAQTRNRSVEVRFYRYADPGIPGSTVAYRARQILIHEADGTTVPLRPLRPFGAGVILADSPDFTTVLGNGESSAGPADAHPPRLGSNYRYFGVRFQPGGALQLGKGPDDRWCVTLVDEKFYRNSTELPANFVTLQLDPHNGSVRSLQP